MRMTKLAFLNFKNSIKNYLSLVLSLAFTILVFLNFQNIIYSDSFEILGRHNKEYVDMLLKVISFVLGCFMFFFIWYATNVFLNKRKREIGTYVFMGLSNQELGKLYAIETTFTALAALLLGIVLGSITTALFQMILLAISGIAVDIHFRFTWQPAAITAGLYLAIYLIFVIKGYVNILRSSVLSMLSAARQNEFMRQKGAVLALKAVLGVGVLGTGYYYAMKDGRQEVLGNVLIAAVLVTAGIYLLFGGLIPLVFQGIAQNKRFLYRRQRCLWINNVIYRMKKNYRTYAMVSVLSLCSVTALATGFAMKYRYDSIVHFENTYTFQLLSDQADLEEKAAGLIREDNGIAYSSRISMLNLDPSLIGEEVYVHTSYCMLNYSELEQLAADTGLAFALEEPGDDAYIKVSHLPLISLVTASEKKTIAIQGNAYRQTQDTTVPYLGYLQQSMNFYVVNSGVYEKLRPLGKMLYAYNYRITDLKNYAVTKEKLGTLVSSTDENYTARVAIDPANSDIDWIRVLYSLCIFMFMVFILASGSILFMKLYNDAFEEKERYKVLKRMGYASLDLKKSVRREVGTAYVLPLFVMAVSSWFSVHALAKMMKTDLLSVNVISVLVVAAVFLFFYVLSAVQFTRECIKEKTQKISGW